ncbi:transposable element Tcb1 transposase [Trichonephila clavipes]|nr:transposable element Tcb1 transposase [Trichonephila clavipes]
MLCFGVVTLRFGDFNPLSIWREKLGGINGRYDNPTNVFTPLSAVVIPVSLFIIYTVSARTIRRRLQQSGLSTRHPLLGLPFTQNHRRLRRQWCDERRMWVAELNEVVFTDESRICLQHHDGRN